MRVGIASDHGGFVLKQLIADLLCDAAYEVVDFGAPQPSPGDDYPITCLRWPELLPPARWIAE
jgi:ribose 5-phosphate isomerase B